MDEGAEVHIFLRVSGSPLCLFPGTAEKPNCIFVCDFLVRGAQAYPLSLIGSQNNPWLSSNLYIC